MPSATATCALLSTAALCGICLAAEIAPSTMAAFVAETPTSSRFDDATTRPKLGSLHELYSDLPSECEVLIKVMASSVNPSDVSPHIQRRPKVLGSDVAGVVEAIGTGCTRLTVGTAVWGDIGANAVASSNQQKTKELGAYAEYVVALESQLGLKPQNVGFIEIGSMPKGAYSNDIVLHLLSRVRVAGGTRTSARGVRCYAHPLSASRTLALLRARSLAQQSR